MRRRKRKGADLKLISYTDYVIYKDLETLHGTWKDIFKNDNPIRIEVGSGKGKFITTLAKENPSVNYISLERKEEVILKGVEKADEMGLENIKFIWGDADFLRDMFADGELDRIYINFCDPWPKNRWIKRRLTHTNYLKMYKELLSEDGELHFKTDNRGLFEFSLNEIAANDWLMKNISLNLANSKFEGNVTTEYEDKFMAMGMPIYRLEAKPRR